MNKDGNIIIGARLQTKDFDKDVQNLEKKANNKQIEVQIKLKKKIAAEDALDAVKKEIEEIENQLADVGEKSERLAELEFKANELGQELSDDENIEMIGLQMSKISEIESDLLAKLDELNKKQIKAEENLKNANNQLIKSKESYEDLNQKIEEYKDKIKSVQVKNIKKSIDDIGSSVSSVIKKVARWGLAVFSIRTAYNFVRQSASTLSQYNEKIATDIEYIRYALAVSLQPLIEAIIRLAYQLLGILNSITKNLFGWDMFKNAGVNAFKKVNGSAKELQKTLAGFDKLNILNENGTTGAAGGVTPSIDLSKMGDADISGTVRLLDKIKVLFDKTFDDIVGNVEKVLIDLGASPQFIAKWKETLGSVKQTFEGLIDFIIGLAKIAVGFLTGDTELVEEGFDQAIGGIGQSIDGLSDTIVNIRDLTLITLGDLIKELGKFALKARAKIEEAIFNFAFELGKGAALYMAESFKSIINSVFSLLERKLNEKIAVINGLVTGINSIIPGVNIGKINAIKLPRLAAGGIVNMPGRGVMVGSAIAGERGREGVVPLDNKQSLETIGRTIAKYASFNADITLEIENRVLARVQKELNADRQFARNGG